MTAQESREELVRMMRLPRIAEDSSTSVAELQRAAYRSADEILASDWLQRVKAEVWDEGYHAGLVDNPYRKES